MSLDGYGYYDFIEDFEIIFSASSIVFTSFLILEDTEDLTSLIKDFECFSSSFKKINIHSLFDCFQIDFSIPTCHEKENLMNIFTKLKSLDFLSKRQFEETMSACKLLNV